jgi:hypothetical protein
MREPARKTSRTGRALRLVATAAVLMALTAVSVRTAMTRPPSAAGRRVDDLVLETWSFVAFPGRGCIGPPDEPHAGPLRRLELAIEDAVGWRSPIARREGLRLDRTMGDMNAIATACELYSMDHDAYPTAASLDEIRRLVEPSYYKKIPCCDAWGNAFAVESDGTTYRIASRGADGLWQDPALPPASPNGAFREATHRELLIDLLRAR